MLLLLMSCSFLNPWNLLKRFFSITIVSFIPYFRLLVCGILVTSVAWFSFFQFCPSCVVKCKQRLINIFVFSYLRRQKLPKTKNEKWGERNITVQSRYILWRLPSHFTYCMRCLPNCSVTTIMDICIH